MSRSLWRCRNRNCPVPHGAVLGRVTAEGGLVLDPVVKSFQCYLDTQRAVVECPRCHAKREFRGNAVVTKPGMESASHAGRSQGPTNASGNGGALGRVVKE